ncbi:unnamed protein product, partial [Arabidopsis halleri]
MHLDLRICSCGSVAVQYKNGVLSMPRVVPNRITSRDIDRQVCDSGCIQSSEIMYY